MLQGRGEEKELFQVYLNQKVFLLIRRNKNTVGENLLGGQSEYFNPFEYLFESIGSMKVFLKDNKTERKYFEKGGNHLNFIKNTLLKV